MKRVWVVRLVVEANDPDITGDGAPYHDDHEMPGMLRQWWDAGMEDREDSPHIVWSEFVRQETANDQGGDDHEE